MCQEIVMCIQLDLWPFCNKRVTKIYSRMDTTMKHFFLRFKLSTSVLQNVLSQTIVCVCAYLCVSVCVSFVSEYACVRECACLCECARVSMSAYAYVF